ncbi:MAG: hypothetical protein EA424_27620 [Planctomycetaceae bacterium]|nr:MAG: hypothetical protein EA424_27620 [Planctomycetaceae bacterium]
MRPPTRRRCGAVSKKDPVHTSGPAPFLSSHSFRSRKSGCTLSTYTNARLEGLNGLFLAARPGAGEYRNITTFITMIYLIGSPPGSIPKPTLNDEGPDLYDPPFPITHPSIERYKLS